MNEHTQTVIVGGGLSGLYAAYLLEQQNQDYLLLEARDRFGGRIVSASPDAQTARVDLGPSWFWPNINPRISALAEALGIPSYKQHGEGHYLVEKARGAPPQAINVGYDIMPDTFRLEGGMQAMVDGLLEKLQAEKRITGSKLTEVSLNNGTYTLSYTKSGETKTLQTQNIIFAMPLRLIARTVSFTPSLNPDLLNTFDGTETWMAAHAKAVFIYDKPFWRDNGFSGSASSNVGPLVEIHDASPELNGQPEYGAIMGFMGINAAARKTAGDETLKKLIQQQLVRMFGSDAENPVSIQYIDWFQEKYTATNDDMATMHGLYGFSQQDENHPNVFFAGTESSRAYGGYLEGALDAAERAVEALMETSLQHC
ncbi:Flavin-dependent L-tryptophan oxidase RebO precursor [Grimontia celer]|uniref:Flavin-dependent L-tryptophan oxidase RebO n=1 Tax=Grimontia celer TaxID=1796497 RepID=A0A128F9F9_9GAMM|nr:FAD-dependent oxidoreductase [Grimontia celer]CZF82936.1 Flavin-dependent L-tryptophan oxidase RebO precursor [Grimontia celer]